MMPFIVLFLRAGLVPAVCGTNGTVAEWFLRRSQKPSLRNSPTGKAARRFDSKIAGAIPTLLTRANLMSATAAVQRDPAPLERAAHDRMANAIRALAMDAVELAKSGHPGLPMGAADIATVLFTQFLKYDAADPQWPDRDRFVLSAGHGSMLLYALLYLL